MLQSSEHKTSQTLLIFAPFLTDPFCLIHEQVPGAILSLQQMRNSPHG